MSELLMNIFLRCEKKKQESTKIVIKREKQFFPFSTLPFARWVELYCQPTKSSGSEFTVFIYFRRKGKMWEIFVEYFPACCWKHIAGESEHVTVSECKKGRKILPDQQNKIAMNKMRNIKIKSCDIKLSSSRRWKKNFNINKFSNPDIYKIIIFQNDFFVFNVQKVRLIVTEQCCYRK